MAPRKRNNSKSPKSRLNRNSENVDVLNDFPSTVLASIPSTYERIPFSELNPTGNYETKCILGKIVQLWPVQTRPRNGHLRKFLLSDGLKVNEQKSKKMVTVFMFDEFATDSDAAEIEGFLAISNFQVEKLTCSSKVTSDCELMLVQIIVKMPSRGNIGPSVWLARKVAATEVPEKTKTPSRTTTKKKQPVPSTSVTTDTRQSEKEVQQVERDSRGRENAGPVGTVCTTKKKQPVPSTSVTTGTRQSEKEVQQVEQDSRGRENAGPVGTVCESPTRSYTYMTLSELTESVDRSKYFHIYGLVDECKLRLHPGKNTYVLELHLSDPSKVSFQCVVHGTKDHMCHDVHPGDIVRIHRLKIENIRGQLKGKCFSPRDIVVFHKDSQDVEPKSVAKSFVFTDDDKTLVKELFAWSREKRQKLISEIRRGDFVDIICQVIAVYVTKTVESVILTVWDGTKTDQFESEHRGYPGEVIDKKLFQIAGEYFVNVWVYGSYGIAAAELKPGMFTEIRDAQLYSPKSDPDNPRLALQPSSRERRGVFVLKPEDPRLDELRKRLKTITEATAVQGDITLGEADSFFLDCDISAFSSQKRNENTGPRQSTSSSETGIDKGGGSVEQSVQCVQQPSTSGQQEVAATKVAQRIEPARDNIDEIVSIVSAGICPGQSTQEFGGTHGEINRKRKQVDASSDGQDLSKKQRNAASELEAVTQLTSSALPAPSQRCNLFGCTQTSQEEWWKDVPTLSVTEGHSDVKPSSISEIAGHSVPYKFRVIAAVLNLKPETTSITKLIRLYCPSCHYISDDAEPDLVPIADKDGLPLYNCPECSRTPRMLENETPTLEYTYLVAFTLHDGTELSNIDAILWLKNAVKFLKGITPEQALLDNMAADSVFNMLWEVCPNCRPLGSGLAAVQNSKWLFYPTLDCCVMSYTAGDVTRYQIFDTVLN